MFSAMMEAIREEAVGFLFNLEVEVQGEAEPTQAASADDPQLDTAMLAAASAEFEAGQEGHAEQAAPQIAAKGLERTGGDRPLTYTAPTIDSEEPVVRTEGGEKPDAGGTNSARRQASRSNPNRGSRGNRKRR
jgi:preprotein translocase subunit SecA